MDKLWQKLTFSAWMKVLGLAALVLGVIQGANEPSFQAGAEDLKLWIAVIVALQGFFGKSNTAHGTSDQPILPAQAAQIAAVAASVPPSSSYVGGAVPGTSDLFYALPGDTTPVGAAVTVGGQKLIKIASAYYEKAN